MTMPTALRGVPIRAIASYLKGKALIPFRRGLMTATSFIKDCERRLARLAGWQQPL